jgi:hypothetical protein
LSVGFIPQAIILFERLFSPFQVQQTEAYMVDKAFLVLNGQNLYPDLTKGGPYLFTAYPPVFFILQAVLIKIVGGLWLAGRLLAVAGYLGCAVLLWSWGRKRWGAIEAGLVLLLFLFSPTWALWGTMVRPDTFSLLLHFSAFLFLYRLSLEAKPSKDRSGRLIFAGLLSGLAVLTKQTTIGLWLAFALYGILKKRWKDLGLFFLGAVPLVLGAVVWLEMSTGGMFLKQTCVWLDTGFDIAVLVRFLVGGLLKEAGWLVVGAVFIVLARPIPLLLKCQMLFAFLQLIELGRNGCAENYYLEFYLYGLFMIAEGWWVFGRSYRAGTKRWVPAIFVVTAFGFLSLCVWPGAPSEQTNQMKLDALKIYQDPGPHLALDVDLPLMAGHRIWYQPVEVNYLYEKGRWDLGALLQDLKAKKFTTVEFYDLPTQYLLPAPVVDAVRKNYHIAVRKYGRVWFVPNSKKTLK